MEELLLGETGLQTSLMMKRNLVGDTKLRVPGNWGPLSPYGGVREAFTEVTLELSC